MSELSIHMSRTAPFTRNGSDVLRWRHIYSTPVYDSHKQNRSIVFISCKRHKPLWVYRTSPIASTSQVSSLQRSTTTSQSCYCSLSSHARSISWITSMENSFSTTQDSKCINRIGFSGRHLKSSVLLSLFVERYEDPFSIDNECMKWDYYH